MDVRSRLAIIGVAAICTLASTAGQAATSQQVRGLVLIPLPGRVGPVLVDGCPGVVEATTTFLARVSVQPHFAVDSGTWGRPFTLTPLVAGSNLDISFRVGSNRIDYALKGINAENGTVPIGATEATVCLRNGLPTRFTYRAG